MNVDRTIERRAGRFPADSPGMSGRGTQRGMASPGDSRSERVRAVVRSRTCVLSPRKPNLGAARSDQARRSRRRQCCCREHALRSLDIWRRPDPELCPPVDFVPCGGVEFVLHAPTSAPAWACQAPADAMERPRCHVVAWPYWSAGPPWSALSLSGDPRASADPGAVQGPQLGSRAAQPYPVQLGWSPGRPASVTKLARVDAGAPGDVT